VSPRTVQRYIARLQDLCIPIEGTPGVGGAYRLKSGFRLPPLMFTDEEAVALTLGLMAIRHLGLSAFAPATEGAGAKLARVLPEPVRDSVRAIEEVVSLEAGPWIITTSAESVLQFAGAICGRRTVLFDYQSHAGVATRREIEPYGLLHMDGRWYAAGRCLLRQDLRTFRLDRVSGIADGTATFDRPADFDIQAYMHRAMPFVQSTYNVELWVDVPVADARRRFAPWRLSMEEENGGTVMKCGRDDLRPFAAMLLAFGCRIVVRNPPELREVFRDLARCAAAGASTATL